MKAAATGVVAHAHCEAGEGRLLVGQPRFQEDVAKDRGHFAPRRLHVDDQQAVGELGGARLHLAGRVHRDGGAIEEEVVLTPKGAKIISLYPAEELPIANPY